jgi:hypothetical protein
MVLTRAGRARPISRQSRVDHAPAATTTTGASIRPADVSTPVTRLPGMMIRVTAVHWRTVAPRTSARRRKPSTVSAGLA